MDISAVKRGFTYAEAMRYLGVKRRTFDALWRPHLTPMQQGTSLVFDRVELDQVFDRFKEGAGAESDAATKTEHNELARNERPKPKKGETETWAEKQQVSIKKQTDPGQPTNGTKALDFSSVASAVLRKRKAG